MNQKQKEYDEKRRAASAAGKQQVSTGMHFQQGSPLGGGTNYASRGHAGNPVSQSYASVAAGVGGIYGSYFSQSYASVAAGVGGIYGSRVVGGINNTMEGKNGPSGAPSYALAGDSRMDLSHECKASAGFSGGIETVFSLVCDWKLVYDLTESPTEIQGAAFRKMKAIMNSLDSSRRDHRLQTFLTDLTIAINRVIELYQNKNTYDILVVVSFFTKVMALRREVISSSSDLKSKAPCVDAISHLLGLVSRLLTACFADIRSVQDLKEMLENSNKDCISEALEDTRHFLSVVLLQPQFDESLKNHAFTLVLRNIGLFRAALLVAARPDILKISDCFSELFFSDVLPKIRSTGQFCIEEVEQIGFVLKILSVGSQVFKDSGRLLEGFKAITTGIEYKPSSWTSSDNFEFVVNAEIKLLESLSIFSELSDLYFKALAQVVIQICVNDGRIETYIGPNILRLASVFLFREDTIKFLGHILALVIENMLKGANFDKKFFQMWLSFRKLLIDFSEPFQYGLMVNLPFRKETICKLSVDEFLQVGLESSLEHTALVNEGICDYLRSKAQEIAKYSLNSYLEQATDDIILLVQIVNFYASSVEQQLQFVMSVLNGIHLAVTRSNKSERIGAIFINFAIMLLRVDDQVSNERDRKAKPLDLEFSDFKEAIERLLRAGVWSQLIYRQVSLDRYSLHYYSSISFFYFYVQTFEKLQASEQEIHNGHQKMVKPPKLYIRLCEVVSQISINEKLYGSRTDDAKVEKLCEFVGEDAFRTKKNLFDANYIFNANTLSLCLVFQSIEQVASQIKKR
jgi:hypothetical protein